MSITQKLGILVFFAVPAIMGGGITYDIFGNFTAVAIFEISLLFIAGAFVSK